MEPSLRAFIEEANTWLGALERTAVPPSDERSARLLALATHVEPDWRFDAVRYRATGLLVHEALTRGDDAFVLDWAAHARDALREGTVDTLAQALTEGRHVPLAAEVLLRHLDDPAGGVRYSAIKGLTRAVAAGVDLSPFLAAMAGGMSSVRYLSTGWTHPLDSIATSDLRGESAAADLAEAVARLAVRGEDRALLSVLRAHDDPEVRAGVQRVVGAAG